MNLLLPPLPVLTSSACMSVSNPASYRMPRLFFQGEWKPEIQLEMNLKHEKVTDTLYEVILKLTVTAKNAGSSRLCVEMFKK